MRSSRSICSVQILEDGDIILKNLDEDLFPGLSDDIKAHSGFADAHAKCAQFFSPCAAKTLSLRFSRSAVDVLNAIKKTMSKYGTNEVTLTGHSLGRYLPLKHIHFT